jgi:hypothetical protein
MIMQVSGRVLNIAAAALWFGAAAAQAASAGSNDSGTVAGWAETVTFPEYGISIDALLDTGADLSSLTDRSGQDYVALIGRKFLAAARVLVDSSRAHILPKSCGPKADGP